MKRIYTVACDDKRGMHPRKRDTQQAVYITMMALRECQRLNHGHVKEMGNEENWMTMI